MIEKVSFLDTSVNCVDYKGFVHNVAEGGIINKINEIINVLNAIVVDTKDGTFIDGSKKPEPADPYAEQRKWIGKACYFWDNNAQTKAFGWLEKIDQEENEAPFMTNFGQWYDNCEPVKPDDDIIYKGE